MKIQPRGDAHTVHECTRYCWLSGWTQSFRPEGYHGPWHLQIAHIASGQGRALRVNDRRAVTVLSPIAHLLHVSDADRLPEMTINGVTYPTIDERHTFFLKRELDSEYFDMDFLKRIWVGTPPEPVRPPAFWCNEFTSRTGILR